MMNMAKLCKPLAMLSALSALILQVLSTITYPKVGNGNGVSAANKMILVQKYNHWSLLLAVLAIYFATMCLIK